MNDNHLHVGLRNKLIDKLARNGVNDTRVLEAMRSIPRHLFIPDNAFYAQAYKDVAFPIGEDQTISRPLTVGIQTELLQTKPTDVVLEVGTGSGYQCAVLSKLVQKIFTIERQEKLFVRTKRLLHQLGMNNIRASYGDGYAGLPAFAPFDKIIITAAAPFVPEDLLLQLKIGGIFVIPLGEGAHQTMYRITRISESDFKREKFGTFQFVPMLEGTSGK